MVDKEKLKTNDMKIPESFGLKWKDAINSIIIMIIANMLMIITNAAEGEFPSIGEFKAGLFGTLKYGVAPYLLKNFFSNDIKIAQNTLSKAKIEGKEAAAPIPPVSAEEKVDISKFLPTTSVPGKPDTN